MSAVFHILMSPKFYPCPCPPHFFSLRIYPYVLTFLISFIFLLFLISSPMAMLSFQYSSSSYSPNLFTFRIPSSILIFSITPLPSHSSIPRFAPFYWSSVFVYKDTTRLKEWSNFDSFQVQSTLIFTFDQWSFEHSRSFAFSLSPILRYLRFFLDWISTEAHLLEIGSSLAICNFYTSLEQVQLQAQIL